MTLERQSTDHILKYNYRCKDHLLEKYCDKDECPIIGENED